MHNFFEPTRLVFGRGALTALKEHISPGASVILITDKILVSLGMAKKVLDVLEETGARNVVFDAVLPSPTEEMVNAALESARANKCDVVIALGGGSPMDVAKMVSVLLTNPDTLQEYMWDFKPIPNPAAKLIAIPTTSGSGSEVGNAAVIVSRGKKGAVAGLQLFPAVALVDPDMTKSMPPHVTAETGIDAFCHAYEAYTSLGGNPVTDAWAWEAMKLIAAYLPRAFANGDDGEAREKMAVASSLAGMSKDNAGPGLGYTHAVSDTICGRIHAAHGLVNAVFLPYAFAYNMPANLEKHAKMGELFGVCTHSGNKRAVAQATLEAIQLFLDDLNIPRDLEKYWEKDSNIDVFVDETAASFAFMNNPRKPDKKILREAYDVVFHLK